MKEERKGVVTAESDSHLRQKTRKKKEEEMKKKVEVARSEVAGKQKYE